MSPERGDSDRKRPRLAPVAVLADCFEAGVEQATVFVSPITDRKLISGVIQRLTNESPLQKFPHLKRVRRTESGMEIILCTDKDDLAKLTSIEGIDVDRIREHKVALNAPLTRTQYQESSLLWPTHFHENKEIESSLDGTFFEVQELQRIHELMRATIIHSNDADKEDSNAVTIVNPATDTVLAMASSCRDEHPALHATLVALDLVARLQGGGAWQTGIPTRAVEEEAQVPFDEEVPYICTGYDVYMLREPCAMCAMALVHSRIRRAFYGVADPIHGSLGSRYKIHCLGGLNHSFKVWKSIMPRECRRALNRINLVSY
ncbi:probable inactive tRNA-specific adenosine deaminase-like protein 3 [Galendromus occidentalis]|uniref:Probable inactive tRNA-specific adenosine deaminase-like protein 3 n=1 Tax=Galendromus occidentalis TaxID=34638 RepID=A0AAJ6QQD9_9ACAR|nr:probable inactive tRNA-specific adenosine deaminase-like protein 3 [Galendromus occidentalis]